MSTSNESDVDQENETIERFSVGIFQRDNNIVASNVTIPTRSIIRSIQPMTRKQIPVDPEQQLISTQGASEGQQVVAGTELLPGDYCIGLVFKDKETADSAGSILIELQIEPLSQFQLSQIMFGLYRSLGFEPSHVLKYPVRSASAGIPFYRKTRSEIEAIGSKVDGLSNLVSSTPDSTVQLTHPAHPAHSAHSARSAPTSPVVQPGNGTISPSSKSAPTSPVTQSTNQPTTQVSHPVNQLTSNDLSDDKVMKEVKSLTDQLESLINAFEKSDPQTKLDSVINRLQAVESKLEESVKDQTNQKQVEQSDQKQSDQKQSTYNRKESKVGSTNRKTNNRSDNEFDEFRREIGTIKKSLAMLSSNLGADWKDELESQLRSTNQKLDSMVKFHPNIVEKLSKLSEQLTEWKDGDKEIRTQWAEKLDKILTDLSDINPKVDKLTDQLTDQLSEQSKKQRDEIYEKLENLGNQLSEPIISVDRFDDFQNQLNSVQSAIDQCGDSIQIDDLDRIIKERKRFHDKLEEAEDYIEMLTDKIQQLERTQFPSYSRSSRSNRR